MQKILYIVSTLKKSGPTNQIYYIIKHLDRSRYEPHLITLSPEPQQGSAWGDFDSLGVCLYTLGLSRIKGLFFAKKHLRSLVGRIKPDIIHTQGIRADMLNASILKDYLSLCTSRNYPYADYPTKFGKLHGSLMARNHMAAFRKMNVMACAKVLQAQLIEHGVQAGVVQNGVDTKKFCLVNASEKKTLKQKLGLRADARIFLSVGSFIPRKDMQTIVAAYQKMEKDVPSRLVLLGDGPLKPEVQSNTDDTMIFPGNVHNVAEYLQAADVFISASHAEGLPNTVLEAMACGLPCILSDIPPHRELYGDKGHFFASGDVDGLAGWMSALDWQGLDDLKRISRRIVEENFSASIMSKAYQDIYSQKVGGEHG